MKVSKIIETFKYRRARLLVLMEDVEPNTGRWHGMNQQQRAIECAIPILEAELERRHAARMNAREEEEAMA